MNETINFLISNKEWVFSGIGIFVLSGIGVFIKFLHSRKKKEENRDVMTQINHANATGSQIGIQNNYYGKDTTNEQRD